MISLKKKINRLKNFQSRTNIAFEKFCNYCGEKDPFCHSCNIIMFDQFCNDVLIKNREPSKAFREIESKAQKEIEKLLKE